MLDAAPRMGRHVDVFVKNNENVQGYERNVIMISVSYGPQGGDGRLHSMALDPVNGAGGECRLNELFSRAGAQSEVYASFDTGDIGPFRMLRDGPCVPTGPDADSPFREGMADVICALGHEADAPIGRAGFRTDLVFRHRGRLCQALNPPNPLWVCGRLVR